MASRSRSKRKGAKRSRRRAGAAKAALPELTNNPEGTQTLEAIRDAEVELELHLVDIDGDEFTTTPEQYDERETKSVVELPDILNEHSGSDEVEPSVLDEIIADLTNARDNVTTRVIVENDNGWSQEVDGDVVPEPRARFTFATDFWPDADVQVFYDRHGGTYVMQIGCQEYSLALWRRAGAKQAGSYLDDDDADGDRPSDPYFSMSGAPARGDYKTVTGFQGAMAKFLAEREVSYQEQVATLAAWEENKAVLPSKQERLAEVLPLALDLIEAKIAAATGVAPVTKRTRRKSRR